MSVENFVRFIMLIYPAALVLAHVLGKVTRPRHGGVQAPARIASPAAARRFTP